MEMMVLAGTVLRANQSNPDRERESFEAAVDGRSEGLREGARLFAALAGIALFAGALGAVPL